MADFQSIASEFVKFYYHTFDTNRAALAGLYRDASMLTFEAQPIMGTNSILEKLTNLPFQKVEHAVTTLDAQPTSGEGLVVLVTGYLRTDDEANPLSYTQAFQLVKDQSSYYVLNDIFRIVYAS